jgi:hypothetical protein
MTLDEWIQRYVDKTGDYPYIREGFQVVFQEEYGFFYWRVDGDVFEVDHVCTDNRLWWREKAVEAAKELGCRIFRTHTHRNPAAYQRLMGCKENKELSRVWPNGKFYYCMEMQVPSKEVEQ